MAAGLSACAAVPPGAAPVAMLAPQTVVVAPVPAPPAPVLVAPTPDLVALAPASVGVASWYRTGRGLHRTCSGEMLNNDALTAASPVLPMGTIIRVARLDGGGSVLLTVNDRMPREHRILDVTEAAARRLGLMDDGLAQVSVTPVSVTPVSVTPVSVTPVMLAEN